MKMKMKLKMIRIVSPRMHFVIITEVIKRVLMLKILKTQILKTKSGGIGPCRINEYNEELLIELSNLALQTYNDQNGASFKFDNLIEAKQQVVAGYMYYITFAAHSGETSGTFRGDVWLKINYEKEVEFCKMI